MWGNERLPAEKSQWLEEQVATLYFRGAMAKLETPIAFLDAPEFQKFWEKDAKMLADAIKRVGKLEEKK